MRRWLEEFKKPNRSRILSFWGPVGIALGVICILNGFSIIEESIAFEAKNGITNLIAGVILLGLGLVMTLLVQEKIGFARVGLTAGLAIFFWGINIGFLPFGWIPVTLGIISLIMGFKWAPK
ncbi:MAG: hypothetical protein PHQ86_07910 [Dehalococcoidales bacterium]|nr:hypothetical protein [Dehalococcoidales bacterium]